MAEPSADVVDVHLEEKSNAAALALENKKLKSNVKTLKTMSLACVLVSIVAVAAILAILIYYSIKEETPDDDEPKNCGKVPPGLPHPRFLFGEPDMPGPFHDVTMKEMNRIRQNLKDQGIITVKAEDASMSDSHIYTIDLQPANKGDVLKYVDADGDAPHRHARVYVFRGDLNTPLVQEYVCGPLHNASLNCAEELSKPFDSRPIESKEYSAYEEKLLPDIHKEFGAILSESFGGSFNYDDCEDDCFNWWAALLSHNVYGTNNARRIWLTPVYDLPYYSVFPVDMSFLCNVDGADPTQFHVEKIWYAGEFFENAQDLKGKYASDTINKIVQTYPTEEEARFATLNRRGTAKPHETLRPPELIEPDGKRYSIRHRKVDYLNMWSFHIRNSPVFGPVLNDIRFLGGRVIYELSLQELTTIYSASNPQARLQVFLNSAFLTGSKSKALVPGADCPRTATFLPITVASQDRDEPAVFKRSICVFEQNTGAPLRRHHSYSQDEKTFYGGMLDTVLIVRSIHAVDNVDFTVDFTFHQNGAIGVSILPSGYLTGNAWSSAESSYGHHIHDFFFGPMFQFVANFKVDLDVGGTTVNSYETIDIKEETVTLRGTNPAKTYSQSKFDYSLKTNEMQAAYMHDFAEPTYHIFHHDAKRTKHGERKAYRIVNQSPVKKLMTDGVGSEPAMAWARYQLAVSKRKEDEQRSSTIYSQFDSITPGNIFQSFINDDESIENEDLVAWVTIGDNHIPTSEDLPIVSTVAKKTSFYIVPYNYFPECPSIASRDAVHIDEKNADKPEEGLKFEFSGTGGVSNERLGGACTYRPSDMTKMWKNDPNELFEINYNKGVY